jgi:hypothetical protein
MLTFRSTIDRNCQSARELKAVSDCAELRAPPATASSSPQKREYQSGESEMAFFRWSCRRNARRGCHSYAPARERSLRSSEKIRARAFQSAGGRSHVAGSGERGAAKQRQKQKSSELAFAAPLACTLPQVLCQLIRYWLRGLNVRTAASVVPHLPPGSTRTTASSSAQKARIPVWFTVSGAALTT